MEKDHVSGDRNIINTTQILTLVLRADPQKESNMELKVLLGLMAADDFSTSGW